ncbi:hypothetical protein N7462_011028 [Penicillium macrosclerotiorum]|uniref:uncharacterized protein n=1 Tax=Penicillium macrosclerotiorum TaxID=303699 RepID=UPI002546776C|nr:uncharacterized protein N7462_011028 [Penicillium macrosclerotiorum]KAJ5666619.1 hypothetical protein N7462_011028 [Penicillium macrosclerotiorum]
MLKIRRGQLRSLAPLRAFHQSLQDRGVDLSRVSITKSYAILAGIESYTLTKRKIHDAHERLNEAKQKLYKIKNHKSK